MKKFVSCVLVMFALVWCGCGGRNEVAPVDSNTGKDSAAKAQSDYMETMKKSGTPLPGMSGSGPQMGPPGGVTPAPSGSGTTPK